ncbi:sugar ABC transporter permease [Streptomyces sp. NPDC088762]|uniref:sugar ABC transporter permease n=1 Tax=Streptomyces sp. NPDC088762 TaxID=3365891 RepID=UPI00382FE19A
MSFTDWADRALAAVMARVTVTETEVGARFPLYADPRDGSWTTTGRGSWAGGFWAGLLWLRARYTGHDADRRAAAECTARLEDWAGADTATRGLILWYGTALAEGDEEATALAERAARACLDDFDPVAGIVPWGGAFGGPRMLARVDGVPGLVALLGGGGGPSGAAAAAAHLDRHLGLLLGRTGEQRPPAWRFDEGDGTWSPLEDPKPGWSRGRAWLLLAIADALLRPDVTAHSSANLVEAAERLMAQDGVVTGRLIPPAEGTDPDGPVDTSAAAITAVALLKLARVPGAWMDTCSYRGVATLSRLAEAHLSREGDGFPPGMLLDGCYDAGKGLAVRHELVWGDFFLALGLASLDGLVDITRV